MEHKYPRFRDALVALAPTDRERGLLLNVRRQTALEWRLGQSTPRLSNIQRFPQLVQALCADFTALAHENDQIAA